MFSTSESVAEIGAALAKVQGELKPAIKDKTNPHFKTKYADLASIWDACRESLSKHQVSIVQSPTAEGAHLILTTQLMHQGEWIRGSFSATARDASPQAIGSALTYLRRYALSAMVGVSVDDDDGESAQPPRQASTQFRSAEHAAYEAALAPPPKAPEPSYFNSDDSADQQKLAYELKNFGIREEFWEAIGKKLHGQSVGKWRAIAGEYKNLP